GSASSSASASCSSPPSGSSQHSSARGCKKSLTWWPSSAHSVQSAHDLSESHDHHQSHRRNNFTSARPKTGNEQYGIRLKHHAASRRSPPAERGPTFELATCRGARRK